MNDDILGKSTTSQKSTGNITADFLAGLALSSDLLASS